MKIVCFASPKGGVGKTTLTANIAFALQRLGMKVTVMDFDVQNALRLHFGIPLDDQRGYVDKALDSSDWRRLLVETPSGVRVLPYGPTTAAQRRRFNTALEQNPNLLRNGLTPLLQGRDSVLLMDTEPGPSPALEAISRLEPLCVNVLLADSASLAVLPTIESGEFFGPQVPGKQLYVVNQFDLRSALNRDISGFLKNRLGSSLLGMVHRDEAVPEAHASQISVFQHAKTSAIVEDLEQIAANLQRLLAMSDEAAETTKNTNNSETAFGAKGRV